MKVPYCPDSSTVKTAVTAAFAVKKQQEPEKTAVIAAFAVRKKAHKKRYS